MLHIVNQSPFSSQQILSCLRLLQAGDHLVLIENAVYAVLNNTEFSASINALPETIAIYALQADLTARGLIENIHSRITLISYAEFVNLTISYIPIMSWS